MEVFEETHWNLIQLLAWVYLGDRRLVRIAADRVSDRGRYEQQVLLPDGSKGWAESQAAAPGPVRLQIESARKGGAAYESFEQAEDAVLAVLREGMLTAYGLENDKGDVKQVPQIQWLGLKFYYDPPRAGPIDTLRFDTTKWHKLKFKCREIMVFWPDPLETALETTGPGDQDQNGDGAGTGPQPDAAPQEAIEASPPDLQSVDQEAAALGKPAVEPPTRPPSDDEAQHPAPAPKEAPKGPPLETDEAKPKTTERPKVGDHVRTARRGRGGPTPGKYVKPLNEYLEAL